jgi:hypothetical protein
MDYLLSIEKKVKNIRIRIWIDIRISFIFWLKYSTHLGFILYES